MKLAYSAITALVSLQLAVYLLESFNMLAPFTFTSPPDPNIAGVFSLSAMSLALLGGGAAAILLVGGLLLRQGTYAIYALLLYGLGVLIPQIQGFITAIPRMFELLKGAGLVIPDAYLSIIIGFFTAIIAYGAWWLIVGVITQREFQ
jgi:hypothetical protein